MQSKILSVIACIFIVSMTGFGRFDFTQLYTLKMDEGPNRSGVQTICVPIKYSKTQNKTIFTIVIFTRKNKKQFWIGLKLVQ